MSTDSPLDSSSEIEPIAPEKAREILYAAIQKRLGEHWNDEESGWRLVTGHDYMARLTRGRRNIDFFVDLLGAVTIEEKAIGPAQVQGRINAWLLLGASLLLALLMGYLSGFLR
ncbi:MAG: hypothetical protein IPK52_09210 [Chloroflexi bacterium]|nr:hypothetical protein [Chloroflexota bacterium]